MATGPIAGAIHDESLTSKRRRPNGVRRIARQNQDERTRDTKRNGREGASKGEGGGTTTEKEKK